MLGWEFPPYFAGGVGTVCYELTRALARKGIQVTYVMPHGPDDVTSQHVKLMVASKELLRLGIKPLRVNSTLTAYASKEEYSWMRQFGGGTGGPIMKRDAKQKGIYGANLLEEMGRFAQAVLAIAEHEEFDVIHAHDWTTIPAALALKKATGKPVIMHVHITEFDKTGGEHADPDVYQIEYQGFHEADVVIAVSNFVKQRLVSKYYVDPAKIRVVYNSVEFNDRAMGVARERISADEKLVLFLGRVTLQKGPDYFLEAAAKVAQIMPNVKFVIAGTGDMLPRMIERAAQMGIGNKVIFPGFVTREEGDKLYRMADLFVMPSVSEPFGIVPLEAMKHGTPVIVSRQSGVSEVIKHALKVDFWDVDDLANKMIAALSYDPLHQMLSQHGSTEIQSFTWENPAEQCIRIYADLAHRPVLVQVR
jgi:glycosyltransferase involved in cell wall biosynthesis